MTFERKSKLGKKREEDKLRKGRETEAEGERERYVSVRKEMHFQRCVWG